MTPNEVYESFIIKANENAQTDNIAVDRGRFAVLFNEASNKFVEWILEKKNEDDIRYIQPILKTKTITESEEKSHYFLFNLPKDYFDIGSVLAKASSSCCKSVNIETYEIKVDNENIILEDESNRPSIEYRETPYYLLDNKIKVFVDDFKINSVELTYYKYPQYIKLIEEENPESEFKDADTIMEFDDKVLNRIISIANSDNSLNTNNPKSQLDKMRVVSKF